MCGRFTLQISPEMLAKIFGLSEIPVFPARYNIAPSQQIAIVRADDSRQNRLDFVTWGLIPSWARDRSIGTKMINARAETVHEKPAFRHAIRYRRCLIPSSGFFEWQQEGARKQPLYIHFQDGMPMVYAGLWETWKTPVGGLLESCAILTTAANGLIAPIHNRMPVILHPEAYSLWLDREMTDPSRLQNLFQPYPAETMAAYAVSTAVNSPLNDTPDLILPLHH
jgi:putative SOS response-associated peptidase YedK